MVPPGRRNTIFVVHQPLTLFTGLNWRSSELTHIYGDDLALTVLSTPLRNQLGHQW